MKKFYAIAAAFVAAMAFVPANAAPSGNSAEPVRCEGIKIASGPSGKGYSKLYADIASVCGARTPVCELRTTGGLDNLTSLSGKKADIGFAQIDTLRDMAPGDDNIAALQAVMTMNYNYLHVLTRTAGYTIVGEKKYGLLPGDKKTVVIRKFSDLKGQNVAVVGSAALLGNTLNRLLKYNMRLIEVPSDEAGFTAVTNGQAVAMFTVSGLPSGAVSKLTQASGLTLVSFDEDITQPYTIRKINYKNIGVYNSKALAVQNVLLTRPFSPNKASQVAAVHQCIVDNLPDLKDGEYEPAWNEMRGDNAVDWPKFNGKAK